MEKIITPAEFMECFGTEKRCRDIYTTNAGRMDSYAQNAEGPMHIAYRTVNISVRTADIRQV